MDAGGDLVLVDVERAAALEDAFHLYLPRIDLRVSSVGTRCSKILVGVLVATVRCAVGSRAALLSDSRYQERETASVDDRPSLAHFIGRV